MTVNYIEVLDPTGKVKQRNARTSTSLGNVNGKVLGLVDNGKPNYDIFLTRLEELLCQRFKFAGIIHVSKGEKDTGAPLNATEMDKLVGKCQVVINGICD